MSSEIGERDYVLDLMDESQDHPASSLREDPTSRDPQSPVAMLTGFHSIALRGISDHWWMACRPSAARRRRSEHHDGRRRRMAFRSIHWRPPNDAKLQVPLAVRSREEETASAAPRPVVGVEDPRIRGSATWNARVRSPVPADTQGSAE